ncbi:MAG: hypothetical protein ACXWDI_16950 [Nocardioides sp.]
MAADYLDDVRRSRCTPRPAPDDARCWPLATPTGDIDLLDFTRHHDKPSLRLLVLHDDSEREFDYVSGAERALDRAASSGWTVVSTKNDWAEVF